jgi:hypothetical protein
MKKRAALTQSSLPPTQGPRLREHRDAGLDALFLLCSGS